jgi:hypothetical protein
MIFALAGRFGADAVAVAGPLVGRCSWPVPGRGPRGAGWSTTVRMAGWGARVCGTDAGIAALSDVGLVAGDGGPS